MWQMAGQGPMLGQAGHFRNYAPEKVPYGIIRYTKESARLYGVLDKRLEGREWIAGDYSIADIACWPWIFFREQHGIDLARTIRTSPAGIEAIHAQAGDSSGRSAPSRRRSR
jgi:GST-like protein